MTMSYGRAVSLFEWAQSNWQYFDAWCCAKGIDPIELPAYRFCNLALYCMKEDLTTESLKTIEENLSLCDSIQHPLKALLTTPASKGVKGSPRVETKQQYIPPWYLGEQKNAAIALRTMKELPK